MNDIDALREAWDEPRAPSAAARTSARAALMDRTAGRTAAATRSAAPGTGRRLPRLGVRLAAVGALATAAVVGVTVVQQAGGVDEHGRPTPVVPGVPAAPVANASELLERAAKSAETRPFTPPKPGQWTYVEQRRRTGETPNGKLSTDPADSSVKRSWVRADGKMRAFKAHGELVKQKVGSGIIPPVGYTRLAQLPTDPGAMMKWINEKTHGMGATYEGAYSVLGTILRDNVLPPKTEAAIFRAIKQIPGVTLVEGRVDMAGRKAIALGRVSEGYIHEEILFDPETYAYLGERAVAIKDHTSEGLDVSRTFEKGDLLRLTVRTAAGVVDEAGQRL